MTLTDNTQIGVSEITQLIADEMASIDRMLDTIKNWYTIEYHSVNKYIESNKKNDLSELKRLLFECANDSRLITEKHHKLVKEFQKWEKLSKFK